MVSTGRKSEESIDISHVDEADIAAYYLNIKSIPCLIHSPLRRDNRPSFALYSPNNIEVNYRDFSTREVGTIWTLLTKIWHCSFEEARRRVYHDLGEAPYSALSKKRSYTKRTPIRTGSNTDLQCKIRDWQNYDIEYWGSYGISLDWLKYADIYPISHKIITKDGQTMIFGADKYAYAYVEFKEGRVTLKIYQPFNTNGFKWSNKHDKSVIGLWTKVPEYGDKVCICSSIKDALCLWSNIGVPSLAIQGEGYSISDTAVKNLKSRFKKIYICLDNDKAGIEDAIKLSKETGFTNVVLPPFEGGKDISDLFKTLQNKEKFKQQILKLFNND